MEWYTVEWQIEANSQEEANQKRDELLATGAKPKAEASDDLLFAGMLGAGVALLATACVTPKSQNTENTQSEDWSSIANRPPKAPRPKFEYRKSQDERDKSSLRKTVFRFTDPESIALRKIIDSMSEQELSDLRTLFNITKECKQIEDQQQIARLELIVEKYGIITKGHLEAVVKGNK